MTKTKIGLVVKKEATKSVPKVESTKVAAAPTASGKIEDQESHKKFVKNLFALVAF